MMQFNQSMPMVQFVLNFMNKYSAKGDKCSRNDPVYQFVTKEAIDLIRETKIIDENEYEIDSGCGSSGNWADCPYVAIMYKKWKKRGVCVAYILSHNYNEVYLTLNQFVDKIEDRELQKRLTEVFTVLDEDVHGFHRGNEDVDFGSTGRRPRKYKKATILYKKYERNNVPDDSTLRNDLADLMDLYRRWIDHCEKAQQIDTEVESEDSEHTPDESDFEQKEFVPVSKIEIELIMRNRKASAIYDTDTNVITILEKSQWALEEQAALLANVKKWREKILNKGVVDTKGEFVRNLDIITKKTGSTPLTAAASIITGGSETGMSRWTLKGEKTSIREYLKSIGVLDDKGNYIPTENRKKAPVGTAEVLVEDEPQDMSSNKEIHGYLHQNVIFYGVPGCGKSFFIENLLKTKDDDGKIIDMPRSYYKRILFHPEYSYSDFVGQLRPVTEGEKITYQFDPGPFTEILLDAYKDREHNYFLIIEEINRGNAPAIFGDLFQLLDRKDGVSEYSIDNKDILDYFKRESEEDDTGAMAQIVETIERDGIRIPENLTIFATMNTCDQNVFTLDTAFKRRWRMSRIVNDFDKDSSISAWKISFKQKSDGFLWKDFAKAVNDAILSNCNDGTAAEDKQLGTHFIKESDLTPARRFAEKVLMYLWDDVAKYDKSQLFDTKNYKTLDMVIDEFVDGNNVFSPNCAELQELYKKMNQPEQTNNNGTEVSLEAEAGTDRPAEGAPEAADEEQGRE